MTGLKGYRTLLFIIWGGWRGELKDTVYILPLLITLVELKTRVRVAIEFINQHMVAKVWDKIGVSNKHYAVHLEGAILSTYEWYVKHVSRSSLI